MIIKILRSLLLPHASNHPQSRLPSRYEWQSEFLFLPAKPAFPYGGWCPKGRRAEDGAIGGQYLLFFGGNFSALAAENQESCPSSIIVVMPLIMSSFP